MNYKISYLLVIFLVGAFVSDAYGEVVGAPQGLINTNITGIKFLDAYFGTSTTKMEVGPGDKNIPLTISMANIGNSDVVGIRGQLFVPTDFTSANGKYMPIYADSDQKATAGSNFHLTFFVDIAENASLKSYPGTIKLDYSRIREAGVRQDTFGFTFNVTGESIVNLKALTPVITSITNNDVVLEISNAGSSTLSNVDIVLENTSTTISSASASTTNVEKVIFDKNHWNVGNVEPDSTKTFSFNVFVPESLKNEPLRIPVKITYFNAHGDQTSVFGFVKLQPVGDSSIKESSQYIDEIEPDSPVPFNIPIESDGMLSFGEHDIRIIVSYKDSMRVEHEISFDTTITISPFADNTDYGSMIGGIITIMVILGIVYFFYRKGKIPYVSKKIQS